jgi:hypothetical protein
MGLGPTFPYGAGGGDPSKWISVWLDKAHVLSNLPFECNHRVFYTGEGPCGLRVIITTSGMKVCRAEDSGESLSTSSQKKKSEHCEYTPNGKLSKVRDALEFPSLDEKTRPPTGSLVTLFAKDKKFCEQFQLVSSSNVRSIDNISPRIQLPEDAEVIESDKTTPYEYNGNYQQYSFDINNDGEDETVVGLHARTHAQDGDTFYIFSDNVVPNPVVKNVGNTQSELAYEKAATQIIPRDWFNHSGATDRESGGKDNGNGNYEVKSVGAPWWDSNDKPIFRFRYLYLLPFEFGDSTYFLTWSQEGNKQHWYTILRPEPNSQATEMCVFQVVQQRY